MARQTVKTKTVKTRKRKTGGNSGYITCNMCKGTGRIKNWHRRG